MKYHNKISCVMLRNKKYVGYFDGENALEMAKEARRTRDVFKCARIYEVYGISLPESVFGMVYRRTDPNTGNSLEEIVKEIFTQ